MRRIGLAAAVILALALTGCSGGKDASMPDVTGKQLDVAKSDIQRAGFGGDVEVIGGGMLGILDESNWMVCEQLPAAGTLISDKPRLTVDRSCGDTEPSAAPSEEPSDTPTVEPTTAPDVTDTTVDALFDKINANELRSGSFYRFTGTAVRPDLWMTGATGEFSAYFAAKGGTNDLLVFVDEAEARKWTEGTAVEVVAESVDVTIDGETTSGWLRAVSTQVVP